MYLIYFILFILLLESITIYFIYNIEQENIENNIEEELNILTSFTNQNIDLNFDFIKHTLLRTSSLYDNFSYYDYTNNLRYNNDPMKDIIELALWIPYITSDKAKNHITYTQKNSPISNYTITQYNGTHINPVTNYTGIYYPVMYTIPLLPKNASLLYGFDLNQLPITRIYFDDALFEKEDYTISNRSSSLGPNLYGVTLTKLTINKTGFHMFLLNTQKLILNSLPKKIKPENLQIGVYNILKNSSIELLYQNTGNFTGIIPKQEYMTNFLYNPISDRTWSVNLYWNQPFIDNIKSKETRILFIASILVSIILNLIIITSYSILKIQKHKNKLNISKYNLASHMLGYVNHEIRNPLNAIIGLIDITETKLEEYAKNIPDVKNIISNLNTANQSCLLLLHIVNDILDIRKIEKNKLQINKSYFKLSNLIYDIKKIISGKLQEKQTIEFITIFPDIEIYSDKTRITQILLNFIVNSIKYTNYGFVELKILEFPQHIKFVVSDSGIGIENESKSKIFNPFEQLDGINSRYGGVGLGLYLCKLLANLLDAEIGFESIRDVGSSFWIIIKKQQINEVV